MPGTYGYQDVADRIEAVLGVRPATSTLRGATAQDRRTEGLRPRHDRVTAGMPRPLSEVSPERQARFDADQIERWLANHPRLRKQRAEHAALQGLTSGAREVDVVRTARAAGLTWARIASILTDHDGHSRTRQGLMKRYRMLKE